MNPDIIAEIIATGFDADRPVLYRYSATVRLHAPDKYPTPKSVEYGASADGALNNAIHKALRYELMHGGTEVHVSSRTLPDEYGIQYLADADKCMTIAGLMPARSQVYKDLMAAAEWYKQQYIAVRYDYLRDR